MEHRATNATCHALTSVALATACLWATPAEALGLGRLTVQSALGETLKAEIEVTSLTAEEAASLRLRVASTEMYRASGVEYNAAMSGVTLQLVRRADGRSVIRVSSERAVQEPFVEAIFEAQWNGGRLVREYTMLFDPPGSGSAPAAVSAPVATPAPVSSGAAMAPAPLAAAPASPNVPKPSTPSRVTAQAMPSAPRVAPPAPAPAPAQAAAPSGSGENYQVKPGESLSRVAARTQKTGVSLEQMLVGLYRGNPQAFINDNINKLKAGAVLSVPSAQQAAAVSPAEAREIIVAQSVDFGSYKGKLAATVPTIPAAAATRQSGGAVQAQVDDRKAPTGADRLQLSQGAVKPGTPAPTNETDKLAQLNRNVEDLRKLQGEATAAPGKTDAPAAVASQATAGAAPASGAATPVAAAAAPKPVAPPPKSAPAAPEPSFLDNLMDSGFLLPGAGVLVALLAGLGLYRLRAKAKKPAGETSFLESRLQPDSFFGASGGQRVDTRDAPITGMSGQSSSLSYSISQLDAIGDVDPVAEADVYLAYGRDLQAEEILKEAMRGAPDRMAIRVKLLEVYAKRRDARAFELLATQVYNMTQGQGEDWVKAQNLGRGLEPDNRLYAPGGEPAGFISGNGRPVDALGATTQPFTDPVPAPTFQPAADARLGDGLDLDLDLGGAPAKPAAAPAAPAPAPAAGGDSNLLDFDLGDLGAPVPPPAAAAPAADFSGFDLANDAAKAGAGAEGGALARKLELADEFRQIGDTEGARDLLEEVVSKADGGLKSKAQAMLDQLSRF